MASLLYGRIRQTQTKVVSIDSRLLLYCRGWTWVVKNHLTAATLAYIQYLGEGAENCTLKVVLRGVKGLTPETCRGSIRGKFETQKMVLAMLLYW